MRHIVEQNALFLDETLLVVDPRQVQRRRAIHRGSHTVLFLVPTLVLGTVLLESLTVPKIEIKNRIKIIYTKFDWN